MSPRNRSNLWPTQPLSPPESYSSDSSGVMPRPLGITSGYDRWAPPSFDAVGGSIRARPAVGSANSNGSTDPSPISSGVSWGSRASVVLFAPPNGSAASAVGTTLATSAMAPITPITQIHRERPRWTTRTPLLSATLFPRLVVRTHPQDLTAHTRVPHGRPCHVERSFRGGRFLTGTSPTGSD